jgi:TRAP-type uncharacterized transport system fused permease subunit
VEAWKVGKGLYIVPILFAFSPLITGGWIERFEVFAVAILGILMFTATVEGFWDRKMGLFERAGFGLTSLLLLSQDSLFGVESPLSWLPWTHIAGLALFVLMMGGHKLRK